MINRKDLWLLVLILIVGSVVAIMEKPSSAVPRIR